MGLTADEAASLPAPKEGELNALAVTDTASAAQDTGIVAGSAPTWHTFAADGASVYITFAPTSGLTDPDDTAVGSGAAVTWIVFANTTQDFVVNGARRFFKAKCKATESSILRYRRSI